jgi:carbonic anhydrase/acetyltransferase-like protein (isoleucine patch superfamily)
VAGSLADRLRNRLVKLKGGTVGGSLDGWDGPELFSLLATLGSRLLRGWILSLRMGGAEGPVLCEGRVRVYHARHIFAGKLLNLEDGCEIIGLSKRGLRFGDRCTVGRLSTIRPTNVLLDEPGEGLLMGNNSNIGAHSFIGCSGFIEIGSNVMMGPSVTLLAESHVHRDALTPMQFQGIERFEIHIEDDCWIGAGVTVLPGVTIGTGSIVASGAVVTSDVSPFSVVAGVPARLLRTRKKD